MARFDPIFNISFIQHSLNDLIYIVNIVLQFNYGRYFNTHSLNIRKALFRKIINEDFAASLQR